MKATKSYSILKRAVVTAYERVKANKGTYGVGEQSNADFEKQLKNNLYKIWNRMSGIPQGGIISPVLANLFLHYVLEDFIKKRSTPT